ncbi:MAG: hypothetical protein HC794_03320 [Nitrospiraceae bacterium]|nr:hypothetical protein [Nitrospiraceae bacterium]
MGLLGTNYFIANPPYVLDKMVAGFEVEMRNMDNVHPVKLRVGVPPGKGSCHTAEVDGYFLEYDTERAGGVFS